MNEPEFESLKARALAGQAIPSAEIAQLTAAQAEDFASFRRAKTGFVLDEGPPAIDLYREKPAP